MRFYRYCPQCMIHKRIRVYWELDNRWYWGVVQDYDEKTGEHLIKYPDCGQGADTEWLMIDHQAPEQIQNSNGDSIMVAASAAVAATDAAEGDVNDAAVADFIAAAGDGSLPVRNEPPTPVKNFISTPRKNTSNSVPVDPPSKAKQEPASASKQMASPGTPNMTMGMQVQLPVPSFHNFYSTAAVSGSFPHPGVPAPFHMPAMHGLPHTSPMHHGGHKAMELVGGSISSPKSSMNINARNKGGPKSWTTVEDRTLIQIVKLQGDPIKWSKVAEAMTDRTGKQCRERYVNHLNPNLKNSDWSPQEDATIFYLYTTMGSQWAKMSKVIPGRTDNGIKNRFHNLKRQLERDDTQRKKNTNPEDYSPFIRNDRIDNIPAVDENNFGNIKELWDMKAGLPILAANTVKNRGDLNTKSSVKFDRFRKAKESGEQCTRCGFYAPSVQCGTQICEKSGWCLSCSMVPPSVCGDMLRNCLNLRKEIECETLAEIISQFGN